jgi:hypothetical protein
MDGKHKEIIQSWFKEVLQEGERGRGHELHVFQVDERWEPESMWISAGLESFDVARRIRDGFQSDTRWAVVVGFFLKSESTPLGVTFHNRAELEQEFSDIAPALFLWPAGEEFWVRVEASQNNAGCSKVQALTAESFFGEKHKMFKCIFLEHTWSGREDYLRAVYLTG